MVLYLEGTSYRKWTLLSVITVLRVRPIYFKSTRPRQITNDLRNTGILGVIHEGESKGQWESIGGVNCYVGTPSKGYDKTKAVLYLSDVFGMQLINNQVGCCHTYTSMLCFCFHCCCQIKLNHHPTLKLIVDSFADNGFLVSLFGRSLRRTALTIMCYQDYRD